MAKKKSSKKPTTTRKALKKLAKKAVEKEAFNAEGAHRKLLRKIAGLERDLATARTNGKTVVANVEWCTNQVRAMASQALQSVHADEIVRIAKHLQSRDDLLRGVASRILRATEQQDDGVPAQQRSVDAVQAGVVRIFRAQSVAIARRGNVVTLACNSFKDAEELLQFLSDKLHRRNN